MHVVFQEKKAVTKVPIARAHPKSTGTKAASSLLAKEPPKGKKVCLFGLRLYVLIEQYVSQNIDNSSDDELNELISAEVQRTEVEASENVPAKLKRKRVMIVV
jgi:hypothetical protein